MRMTRPPVTLLILLCGVVSPAWTQSDDTLAALQARSEISADDRQAIQTYVNRLVADLIGQDAAQARTAARLLRDAHQGSDAFQHAYAGACNEVFGTGFKKAELLPAVRMLTILGTFQELETHAVFIEALKDDRVGVRAAAAVGLRSLRPQIAAAAGDVYANVLQALTAAGRQEKSRDTLRAVYAALDYAALPSPPDLKPVVRAVLDLLEARARSYAARQPLVAAGADDAGLSLCAGLLKTMDDAERRRLTIITATMMRFALEEYTSPDKNLMEVRAVTSPEMAAYRDGMERLVVVGEGLLKSLLSPPNTPDVLGSMRKLNKAALKLQWKEWVTLLQRATDQDFTLAEQPEAKPANP